MALKEDFLTELFYKAHDTMKHFTMPKRDQYMTATMQI